MSNERGIIERLRSHKAYNTFTDGPLVLEAATRIEQLEAALQEAITRMTEAARDAGHWKGKYEAAGYPGTLDGWIETAKALKAENARLREALKPFADIPANGASGGPLVAGHVWYEDGSSGYGDAKHSEVRGAIISAHDLRRARAALAGKAGT